MALDTQNKRTAVLNWGVGSLPVADGTLDSGDREQLLGVPRFSDGTGPPPPPASATTSRLGITMGISI